MATSKRDIVIVGGGGAGSQIARALSQQLEAGSHSITVIESREFFTHYPGCLRMLVSDRDHLEETALIPLDKLFPSGNGKLVRAYISSISQNDKGQGGKVTTDGGNVYNYDILVLAPGNVWEGPLAFPSSRKAAVAFVEEWREKIKKSKGIAIVGGGAVGCELAGEIRDIYPEKSLSVIQRESQLLVSTYPDKFRADVQRRLAERDIRVITNDEIQDIFEYPAERVATRKGTFVDADLVIPCRGGHPNTGFISSLGENLLTSAGCVKVDQYLQVQGKPGVFAAGDIIEWAEVKQVVKTAGHATTIVANIKSILAGKPPAAVYKPMFEILALTNGAGGGATYMGILWGLHFGNWFTRFLKAKDLFITKTRQGLGY
ncbi:FAD/NAD-P-binding domain-containing protein [Gymnopilus junonius]|uniref:FAD/NAD-P-binding domain-containing protein n=1 Tax=Gymnopilus junonius TaxID=109634 RepID=A0A9P5TL96_GYMJU|nr:FAD/NAD-P-binding domain-containing protein [Gymnopilus junonius]